MKLGRYELSRRAIAIGLTSLGVLVLAGVAIIASRATTRKEVMSTFQVQRGPLTISVGERGTIRARQQEVIKSLVEGQSTIIYLIDEGQHVKKGDLLVELDSSKLQDAMVNQQIQVQNAEANYIGTRENLEVVKNQAKADIAKAQLDAQFAKEDLRKYKEGDYPNELATAQSKITIAKEELQRAKEKLRWTEVLFKEKYVSETELQADRLSAQKTTLDLDLAQRSLTLLQDYTYKRKIDELESQVSQTDMALERATRKAAADLAQAEADLTAKESEFQRQKSQLSKTQSQIQSCKMYAPTDGLVVYATTGQNRGGRTEPLEEGASVRERQDLVYLPTATDMMAEIKIHESNLNKVRVGMPVVLTIDALPGVRYAGRVSRIAPLPDGASMWMNPDLKVYTTEIILDGDGTALKTGMSCMARIVVDNIADALHLPVQAVVRDQDATVVYVLDEDGQPQRRPVTLGLDNNDRVHIVSGVNEGEFVWATPPMSGNVQQANAASTQPTVAVLPSAAAAAPATAPAAAVVPVAPVAPVVQVGEKTPAASAADWASMTPEQRREQMQRMTPEQRAAARARMEASMTPEQREQFARRRRDGAGAGEGRPQRDGGGAAGQGPGRGQ